MRVQQDCCTHLPATVKRFDSVLHRPLKSFDVNGAGGYPRYKQLWISHSFLSLISLPFCYCVSFPSLLRLKSAVVPYQFCQSLEMSKLSFVPYLPVSFFIWCFYQGTTFCLSLFYSQSLAFFHLSPYPAPAFAFPAITPRISPAGKF